jgi:ribonuclease P protein component
MRPTTPRGEQFPQWVRLRRRSEFEHVYRGGRKCVRRLLVVYAAARVCDGPGGPVPTRLGITASRRAAGKAVTRNRFRRRVREVFRRLHGDLAPGWDIVVNARGAAVEASGAALEKDFRSCLIALELLPPADGLPPPPSSPPASCCDGGPSPSSADTSSP